MRATEQYAALEQGLTECLEVTGLGLQRVNIVVGTKSVITEKWNEAMAKLAMPKAAWNSVIGRKMRVLEFYWKYMTLSDRPLGARTWNKRGGDASRGPR